MDLVTTSRSGLDLDISVAWAHCLSDEAARDLVNQYTQGCPFDFLGEPRVNVLELNLALDGLR